MNISARFYLTQFTYGAMSASSAEFGVVTRGEHNRPWSVATPSGRMKIASMTEAERDWMAAQVNQRRGNGHGCEFDVFISDTEPSHQLRRPVRVSGVTNRRADDLEARVHLSGTGAWTEVELYITNLAALTPMLECFNRPDHQLWLSLR